MKRLRRWILTALAIAIVAYGIYHQMLWENTSPRAQQAWLVEFFKEKGFTAIWELSDTTGMKDFKLHVPNAQTDQLYRHNFDALRESNFIKFFERKTHKIFFVFGPRVYVIESTQDEGTLQSSISLSIPGGGQIWFLAKGGGEFSLASQADLEQHFPYPEIKSLRTQPLFVLWTLWGISIALTSWSIVEWKHSNRRRKSLVKIRVRMAPVIEEQPIKRTRSLTKVYHPSTGPPPDAQRKILLERLKTFITQEENLTHREQLEELYLEVCDEPRISLIKYAVYTQAQAILSAHSRESEEKIDPVPKKDVPDTSESTQEQQDIEQLSNIAAYVPTPLAPCVTRILAVLLRLSGKKPFIGEHRILRVNLQRKVCGRDFSPEEFMGAFEWLVRQGVIVQGNIHGADNSCSINPRIDQAKTLKGKAIIGIAIRIRYNMVKQR